MANERPTVRWKPADVRAMVARKDAFTVALWAENGIPVVEVTEDDTVKIEDADVDRMASDMAGDKVTPPPRTKTLPPSFPVKPPKLSDYEQGIADMAAVFLEYLPVEPHVVNFYMDQARKRRSR